MKSPNLLDSTHKLSMRCDPTWLAGQPPCLSIIAYPISQVGSGRWNTCQICGCCGLGLTRAHPYLMDKQLIFRDGSGHCAGFVLCGLGSCRLACGPDLKSQISPLTQSWQCQTNLCTDHCKSLPTHGWEYCDKCFIHTVPFPALLSFLRNCSNSG